MISGDVTAVVSHWTEDGSRIVTEATIATPSGAVVTVSQLGGSVDGLAQRTIPDDTPRLAVGMRVELDTHDAPDLAGAMHTAVDRARVVDYTPDFVHTVEKSHGQPIYWENSCVFVAVADEGTKDINGDNEFPVIDTSIATWNAGTASCSYLTVMNTGRVKDTEVDGNDHVNLIKFRDVSFCIPATMDDMVRCHDPNAAGITTATYIDAPGKVRDGAIVDADIELNGANFDLGIDGVTLGNKGCIADLQNTLTHELGHLHGLEHTCLAPGDPARIDGNGDPVPDCGPGLSPAITEATMYPYQDCGETKKSSLEPDDIAGICAIYPTASDPQKCEPVPVPDTTPKSALGCCATGGGSPLGTVAILAFAGVVLRRRAKLAR